MRTATQNTLTRIQGLVQLIPCIEPNFIMLFRDAVRLRTALQTLPPAMFLSEHRRLQSTSTTIGSWRKSTFLEETQYHVRTTTDCPFIKILKHLLPLLGAHLGGVAGVIQAVVFILHRLLVRSSPLMPWPRGGDGSDRKGKALTDTKFEETRVRQASERNIPALAENLYCV